jgi:hypothetical protein
MSKNLVTFDECEQIVRKLLGDESCTEVKVIDYDVNNYCDGYPGFLGEYFLLKIKFSNVSEKSNT